jgi:hypothetical protein
MNIQNDVICPVLRENCKSKQETDFIARPADQAFLPFWFVDVTVIT